MSRYFEAPCGNAFCQHGKTSVANIFTICLLRFYCVQRTHLAGFMSHMPYLKKSCIKETYMHFTFAPFAYSWTMDTVVENHSKMLILLCHCSKYVRDMRPELRGLLLLKIVYPIFYISAEISRKFLDRWTYDDSFPLFIAGKPN